MLSIREAARVQFETLPVAAPQELPPELPDRLRYFGDYVLLDEIARGGMGIVYRARQISLDRLVAVKMVQAGEFASAEKLQRFHTEAEAAAQLTHPHIVRIHEIGEQDGLQYFSMDLVNGQTLGELSNDTALPSREAAILARKLAGAVQYAHESGVIHRDLKPGNVLVDESGEPHITDFGLAKRVDGDSNLTATGMILGTPSFMPPEQATGRLREVGKAADTWALGAILYDTLTGRPPFIGATPLETLRMVVETDPIPPRMLMSSIPVDLETICLKCLQKDPTARYASARDLEEDLERFLSGKPILAKPVGVLGRLKKWAARNPAIATLSTLAVLAATIAVSTLVVSNIRISASNERERKTASLQRIALAQFEWRGGQVQAAETLLEQCPEDLRNWEWDYTWSLIHAELVTIPNVARVFGFSQDGELLMAERGNRSSSTDLVSFRTATGEQHSSLGVRMHSQTRLSPSGELLATARTTREGLAWKTRLRVRRTVDVEELLQVQVSGMSIDFVFHPSSARIAVASPGRVATYDLESGELAYSLAVENEKPSCVFVGRGHKLAVIEQQKLDSFGRTSSGIPCVSIFDLETREREERLETIAFTVGGWTRLASSPDGQWIAAATQDAIALWNLSSRAPPKTLGSLGTVLQFSPDSAFLAVLGDGVAKILDVRTGEILAHRRGVGTQVAWHPDSRRFATDSYGGAVRIWDRQLGNESRLLSGSTDTHSVGFSRDGRLVALATDEVQITTRPTPNSTTTTGVRAVVVRRVGDGEIVTHWRIGERQVESVEDLAVAADRMAIVTSYNGERGEPPCRVTVRELTGGAPILELERPAELRLRSVELSADGKRVAIGSGVNDGVIEAYGVDSGERLFQVALSVGELAVHPDGRYLAASLGSGAKEPVLHVYDIDGSRLVRKHHIEGPGHIAAIAYSRCGRYLAAAATLAWRPLDRDKSSPGRVRVWQSRDGSPVAQFSEYSTPTDALTFSPAGDRLVSGNRDGTIRMRELPSGQVCLSLQASDKGVLDVEFSPDGARLVSVSTDATRLWEAAE